MTQQTSTQESMSYLTICHSQTYWNRRLKRYLGNFITIFSLGRLENSALWVYRRTPLLLTSTIFQAHPSSIWRLAHRHKPTERSARKTQHRLDLTQPRKVHSTKLATTKQAKANKSSIRSSDMSANETNLLMFYNGMVTDQTTILQSRHIITYNILLSANEDASIKKIKSLHYWL